MRRQRCALQCLRLATVIAATTLAGCHRGDTWIGGGQAADNAPSFVSDFLRQVLAAVVL